MHQDFTTLPENRERYQVVDAALSYAARGWRVFPVRPRSKRPLIKGWPFNAATEADQIERWWDQWPTANVGVACGPESGLFILDVDGDPSELLEGHHLPVTVTQRTGGGGWQYFYAWPPHLDGLPTSKAGVLPKVDIRGKGGFVVAPPSIHPSGSRYEWALGLSPSETELANPPDWLIEILQQRPRGGGGQTNLPDWRRIVTSKCPEGQRNATLARLVGHLLRRGVDPIVTRDLALAWAEARCSPPLPPEEAIKVVNSIASRELQRLGGAHGRG